MTSNSAPSFFVTKLSLFDDGRSLLLAFSNTMEGDSTLVTFVNAYVVRISQHSPFGERNRFCTLKWHDVEGAECSTYLADFGYPAKDKLWWSTQSTATRRELSSGKLGFLWREWREDSLPDPRMCVAEVRGDLNCDILCNNIRFDPHCDGIQEDANQLEKERPFYVQVPSEDEQSTNFVLVRPNDARFESICRRFGAGTPLLLSREQLRRSFSIQNVRLAHGIDTLYVDLRESIEPYAKREFEIRNVHAIELKRAFEDVWPLRITYLGIPNIGEPGELRLVESGFISDVMQSDGAKLCKYAFGNAVTIVCSRTEKTAKP